MPDLAESDMRMLNRSKSTLSVFTFTRSVRLFARFLTLIGIPLSYSIADGLALGFISYPLIKFFTGRGREIGWLTYVLALVLVLYFIFVRSRMG